MLGDGGSSSSDLVSSSSSDEEEETSIPQRIARKTNNDSSKKSTLSYDELTKHGYSGGLSVLNVPAPRRNTVSDDQDWSWSGGTKRKAGGDDDQESETYAQREQTRKLANEGAEQFASAMVNEYAITKKQRKDAAEETRLSLSFSKKEKRKRNLGQASRGKNYVEEEKRQLRDHKVYSGFD